MASITGILADLQRRGVLRVAGIYCVAAWVISEIAISLEQPLGLPDWLDTSIVIVLAIGFPIGLLLAYAFNLTPEGIRRHQPDEPGNTMAPAIAGTAFIALSITLAAFGFILWQVFSSGNPRNSGQDEVTDRHRITDVSQPVPGYAGRKAIAVLPFINMSGDANQGYLADGIAEDIITELYAYQTFPVIARTSTFRYKGLSLDVRDIAADLGAGYVLEGSLRRIGERLRVTAQLIDDQGKHLWAESYDRPWSDILNVQDEITYSIVEAIEPEVIRSETARSRRASNQDLVAWDYYLQARALSGEEFSGSTLSGVPVTLETNEEAWRLANKALESAPEFAALYALLSHIDGVAILTLGHLLEPEDINMRIDRGLENAARARTLDPFEATACACQIMLLLAKQDVAAAVEIGESALRENPGSAFILAGLAKALQVAGDFDWSLALIEKAKRLSPKGISMPTYLLFEAVIRQSMGDMAGARRVARQARLLAGAWSTMNLIEITSYLAEGERDKALQSVDDWRRELPNANPVAGFWPEPFPQAIIDRVEEPLRSRLQGKNYPEGITIVMQDLGWSPSLANY
jgi:TolB-like protein/tetratricopeptide (TPR) repeat protein